MFYIMHELAVMSLSLPAETLLEQLPGAPHACHSPGQPWLFCGAVFAGQDTSHSSQNISSWGLRRPCRLWEHPLPCEGHRRTRPQGTRPEPQGSGRTQGRPGLGEPCGSSLPAWDVRPNTPISSSLLDLCVLSPSTSPTQRTHSRIPKFYRKDNILSLNAVPSG